MRRANVRPTVQGLEGRELMACQVFEEGGVLSIIGDNRANDVLVYDVDGNFTEDERSDIEVVCDGQLYTVGSQVTDIRTDLRNGNDRLTYDLGDPTLIQTFLPTRNLAAFLGNGNDRVNLNVNGFTFEAGLDLQALGPGSWNLQFDLGGGNDAFAAGLNADLLGLERDTGTEFNALSIGVFGGGGNDRIDVQAVRALRVELSSLAIVLRGGAGNDTISTGSAEDLRVEESSVSFERYGDNGNDRIFGNLEFENAGESVIDQVIDTGAGSDLVQFFTRNRSRRLLAALRGR